MEFDHAEVAPWPEFARWYDLTMEEQRIYNEEGDEERAPLLDGVDAERGPLERAMLGREPKTLQHLGMVAVIELRNAEKYRDPDGEGCKLLHLGQLENANGCSSQGADLIKRTIMLALANDLLPGVVIYGESV